MQIRPAEEADFPQIAEILANEILNGQAHFGTDPPDPKDLVADWRTSSDIYPILVAADQQTILGFAKASPWKERGAYRWTTEVGIYVHPEHQGQGIGKALYEELLPELKRRGFHTILAGIALPNEPSIRLHEAMGMKHVGTLPAVGRKFNRWIDVGYWSCHFDESSSR